MDVFPRAVPLPFSEPSRAAKSELAFRPSWPSLITGEQYGDTFELAILPSNQSITIWPGLTLAPAESFIPPLSDVVGRPASPIQTRLVSSFPTHIGLPT